MTIYISRTRDATERLREYATQHRELSEFNFSRGRKLLTNRIRPLPRVLARKTVATSDMDEQLIDLVRGYPVSIRCEKRRLQGRAGQVKCLESHCRLSQERTGECIAAMYVFIFI